MTARSVLCPRFVGRLIGRFRLRFGLLGLLAAVPLAQAEPRDFAAYVTRLGGDSEAAQPYIAKFLAYIEDAAGWPKGSSKGVFFSSRKEILAHLATSKPALAMVEPAFYLEQRKALGAEPIAQVVSKDLVSDRLHLVVKDPALRNLNDLKGKRLFSQLADSPAYLSKIVLDGQVDATQHFQLKVVGQAMKGVRAVLRGEAEATLLDDEQLAAAKKIEGGGALRSVYDSPPLPPMPLLILSHGKKAPLSVEERKKLSKVLLDMCGTPKGGEVCREMHITKFAPADGAAFVQAQKRYD